MSTLDKIITSAALFGLGVSVIIAYLKVNKLWARRHIKEVAESISVAAALLSLLTTVPFLVKFIVVDGDFVAAGKFLLSLAVFFVFFLVGIGFWVKREEKLGWWRMLRSALATERGELTYLVRSFARPKEASSILRILRLVSMVDQDLDDREKEMLVSVAMPWGISPDDIRLEPGEDGADIAAVGAAFSEYLATKPPAGQVEKVFDLVRFMVHADRKVTEDERLILEEAGAAVRAYLHQGESSPDVYEVLLVPQNETQLARMAEEVADPSLHDRAGGRAVVAGSYFSEGFARAICMRFRRKRFFCTVERLTAEGERIQLPG